MSKPRTTLSDSSFSPQASSSRHNVSNSTTFTTSLGSPSKAADVAESFLTRFILTPLRMISFLLSLALIDHRNCSYRVEQHTHAHTSLLGRMKQALSSPWQTPEPYSDPNPAAQMASSEHMRTDWEKRKEEGRWTMRKKHRKMMKMEIRDALEIRRWVVVGLVLLSVLGGVGGILAVTVLWRRWTVIISIA